MRPLRYSVNVTLDGRGDHRACPTDEELHRHFAGRLAQAEEEVATGVDEATEWWSSVQAQ